MASHTEIFLLKKVAPELLSKRGKVSVLFLYIIFSLIAAFGVYSCEMEFDFDFFLTDKSLMFYKFQKAKKEYFSEKGSLINILVNNTDVNFYAPETQLHMLEFEDALQRCKDCRKSWFIRDSLDFWYPHFRNWLNDKNCDIAPKGLDPFVKVLEAPVFESCLKRWTNDDYIGQSFREHLKYS